MRKESMRLFIAITLDDTAREALCSLQRETIRMGVTGNFTRPENLHLTLAFIGEYSDPAHVLEVIRALPWKPCKLDFQEFGAFDDIWWVGVEANEGVATYVEQLRQALMAAGIPCDQREFIPHITLIRKARFDKEQLPPLHVPAYSMEVDHVSLMQSGSGRNGVIYTEIKGEFDD